jgi:hypothetical protein
VRSTVSSARMWVAEAMHMKNATTIVVVGIESRMLTGCWTLADDGDVNIFVYVFIL